MDTFPSKGKRTLLPLRKAEEKTVIFPCRPTIQGSEMANVVSRGGGNASGGGQGHVKAWALPWGACRALLLLPTPPTPALRGS